MSAAGEMRKLANVLRDDAEALSREAERVRGAGYNGPREVFEKIARSLELLLDNLTIFVALGEGECDRLEGLCPNEARELRRALRRARDLIEELRP